MILNVRWGNQVTEEDRILVEYMTLFQLLGSSFVTPKSSVTVDMVKKNILEAHAYFSSYDYES